jgi:hypothetical protein
MNPPDLEIHLYELSAYVSIATSSKSNVPIIYIYLILYGNIRGTPNPGRYGRALEKDPRSETSPALGFAVLTN